MATVFWNSKGVIITDYLPKGSTVTDTYYADELRKLCEALKSKRRGKLRRAVLLLHDMNSSTRLVHKSCRNDGTSV